MRIEHPYEFVQGTTPLLISMPHPGLLLPDEVADLLTSEARALPDTDWHIPQLYGFAAKMGASLVMARYSRFAVDLNRPEDDTPLYQTATTGLFPDILFDGTSIFRPGAARSDEIKTRVQGAHLAPLSRQADGRAQPHQGRVRPRRPARRAFDPRRDPAPVRRPAARLQHRHQRRQELREEPVATPSCKACDAPGYRHVLNGRFKGGHITRHYGQPDRAFHAVQLELAQRTYMNEQPPFDYRPDCGGEGAAGPAAAGADDDRLAALASMAKSARQMPVRCRMNATCGAAVRRRDAIHMHVQLALLPMARRADRTAIIAPSGRHRQRASLSYHRRA